MNVEDGIKLQAHLDGELTGREAQQVAALIENDAEARGLFGELQQTKVWLKANELEMRLPESREFFWSKIERDIQRLDTVPADQQIPAFDVSSLAQLGKEGAPGWRTSCRNSVSP